MLEGIIAFFQFPTLQLPISTHRLPPWTCRDPCNLTYTTDALTTRPESDARGPQPQHLHLRGAASALPPP